LIWGGAKKVDGGAGLGTRPGIPERNTINAPSTRNKKAPYRNNGGSRPDVLDVNGIAGLLGISADTIYDLLKSGELPDRKVGFWANCRAHRST
jgi:hypothetical protein